MSFLINMLKIAGIIPARYASTRFPGKPLIDIRGKSMIQRVYEQASQCPDLHYLAVATDSEAICETVLDFGGKVHMTRSTHPSGTDRVGEVALELPQYDVFINIQGDEPFLHPRQLSELCAVFQAEPQTRIATLVKKITAVEDLLSPTTAKVVRDQHNNVLYFSRFPIPFVRDHPVGHELPTTPLFYKHVGIYAYQRETLLKLVQLPVCALEETEKLEQLRWLYHGYSIKAVETEYDSISIDTPEDLARVLQQFA